MRSTRTVLAGICCSLAACAALTLGTAGQALASELPTGTAVQGGPQEEVPWTAPDPEVPWTGPIQIVVTGAGGIATVVLDTIEVPWT